MTVVLDDTQLTLENPISPQCSRCLHLLDATSRKCAAFEYIPSQVWDGEVSHRTAVSGDNGIVYKRRWPPRG